MSLYTSSGLERTVQRDAPYTEQAVQKARGSTPSKWQGAEGVVVQRSIYISAWMFKDVPTTKREKKNKKTSMVI